MPRISQAARDQRRQRFIDAAWRCAARSGYRDTTIDDVCVEAGLSKGAFYGYFESKQALLLTLLEEDAMALDRLLVGLDAQSLGSREKLMRFTHGMLQRSDDPAHVQVRVDLWNAMTTEAAVRERFVAATDRRRAVLERWIVAGMQSGELVEIPPKAFASLLLALGDGLLLHSGLQPNAFRWPRVRIAVDILLESIRSRDTVAKRDVIAAARRK
ncbi:MAG: TetR/AcrR family transcriptional regulator [Candidatus Dormibacteraceae bacterium]